MLWELTCSIILISEVRSIGWARDKCRPECTSILALFQPWYIYVAGVSAFFKWSCEVVIVDLVVVDESY